MIIFISSTNLVSAVCHIQVHVLELYKFIRPTSNVIVPFTGDTTLPPTAFSQPEPDGDLKEVLKNIRRQLCEIWSNLPGDKSRKRAIKRLLLKWHPDKNPGREEIYTKVFQQIQRYVLWLNNGNKLQSEDDVHNFDEYYTSQTGSHGTRDESNVYADFFCNIYSRGRFHAKSRTSHHSASSSPGFYHFPHSPPRSRANPQPGEGRRWMRQARQDLKAARVTFTHGDHRVCNWACYQAYQVYMSVNRT